MAWDNVSAKPFEFGSKGVTAAAGWVRIAETTGNSMSAMIGASGRFTIIDRSTGYPCVSTLEASVEIGSVDLIQVGGTSYANTRGIDKARIVYVTTWDSQLKAYLEVHFSSQSLFDLHCDYVGRGWTLIDSVAVDDTPTDGRTAYTINLYDKSIVAAKFYGAFHGNATSATSAGSATRLSFTTLDNNSDMNNFTSTGVYGQTGTAVIHTFVNKPSGSPVGEMRLEVIGCNNSNTYLFQKYWARKDTNWGLYIRTKGDSGWTDWVQVIHSGNIGGQSVNYAASAGSAPASDVYPWAKASTKPSYTFNEIVKNGNDALTAPSDGHIRFDSRINKDTSGVPATINNSNAILTINRHDGNYNSQLGFASDGRLKYRSFDGEAIDASRTWNILAYKSEIPTKLSQLTNDSGFITGITKNMVTTALGYTPPISDTNTVTVVADTTNKKIHFSESSDADIKFTGGTNKFTVTDGHGASFDVNITPSIAWTNVSDKPTSMQSSDLAESNGNVVFTRGSKNILLNHPNISSQASELPQKFGNNTIYEKAISYVHSGTDTSISVDISSYIPSGAVIMSVKMFHPAQGTAYDVRIHKNGPIYTLKATKDATGTSNVAWNVIIQYYIDENEYYS